MNNFQIGLSITFVVAFVIAVAIFAGIIKVPTKASKAVGGAAGQVILWGTLDGGVLAKPLEDFNFKKPYNVKYVKKNIETLDQELLEALASGKGPDLVLMPPELLWHFKDKAYMIPYTGYSERSYLDTFVPEANMYLFKDGILALPFKIDPLVLYYNRDYFTNAGIVNYPRTWTDVITDVPLLTNKDANGNIIRSAIALGTFGNTTNAKAIMSALLFQAGNPIMSYDRNEDTINPTFKSNFSGKASEDALAFYQSFANPAVSNYSWNAVFPNARDAFVAGDVAMYIGYASELTSLHDKNPNLNFDVVTIPQTAEGDTKATYGNLEGLMVMNSSRNLTTAYVVAALLTGKDFMNTIIPNLLLPPVRRDLLAERPTDPALLVFYTAALNARGWIDPNTNETDAIFAKMLQDITTGIATPAQVLTDAQATLSLYLGK
jgi:ABC-type glycerol-3-phosphate transport system substrate-binding protein